MKHFILFLFLSFNFITLAQTDTAYYNRDWYPTNKKLASYYRTTKKIKDSLWYFTDYYIQNNQLQNTGYLKALEPEIRDSIFTWYFDNGNISLQGNYDHQKRDGKWIQNYESGSLKREGKFRDDAREGKWKWLYEDGSTKSIATYREGKLTGKRIWWYKNGKPKIEEHFINGRLDSLYYEWYNDGTKKLRALYVNGQLNDTLLEWHQNGVLKSKRVYISGIEIDDVAIWQDSEGNEVEKEAIVNEKSDHQLLWKISGNGLVKDSYLFGTMHVRDPRAFEFSDSMVTIFEQCEGMSMEIHPDSMYAFNFKLSDKERTKTLPASEIPASSSSRNNSYSRWDYWYGYNTGWLVDLNKLFNRAYGPKNAFPYFVDVYLFYVAKWNGKKTFGLETIEDHINAGNDLPTYHKSYDILSHFNPDEELIHVYQQGNIKKIQALMNFLTNEEFNYRLLTLRNYKMADQIDSLSRQYSMFNTCGCAHLYGEEGVVELLRQKGYTVEPVKAFFSEKKIEKNERISYQPNWKKQMYNGYEFIMPEKAIESKNNRHIKLLSMDLIHKIGFSFFTVNLNYDTATLDLKNPKNLIFKYLRLDEDKLKNYKTEKDKGKLIIYFNEERYSSVHHHKVIVNQLANELVFMEVGILDKEEIDEKYIWSFFNSVKKMNLGKTSKSDPENWYALHDSIGAFTINMPVKPSYFQLDKLHHYHAYDTNNRNQYFVRYYDYRNGTKLSDSIYFSRVLNTYNNKYGEPKKKDYFEYEGYNALKIEYTFLKGYAVKIHVYRRGDRDYLLVAYKDPTDKQKSYQEFFNSFRFTPFKTPVWYKLESPQDSMQVKFPTKINANKSDYYHESYHDDWFHVLDNSEEFIYDENGIDWGFEYDYYGDYIDEKYQSLFDYSQSYVSIDTLSNVRYKLEEWAYADFAYVENLDSMLEEYSTYHFDSTYNVKYFPDSSLYKEQNIARSYNNIVTKYQIYYKHGHIYELTAHYPLNYDTAIIDSFFYSFNISMLPDTIDPATDKSLDLFEALSSSDTLLQTKASGALYYYPFDTSHLSAIYKNIIREHEADTLEIINNTFDLIAVLSNVNDDSTISFLDQFYTQHCDTVLKQKRVLQVLADIGTEKSLKKLLAIIPDSLPKERNHSLMYVFYDSLSLSSNIYPQLYVKKDHYNYGLSVLNITKNLWIGDSVPYKGVLNYRDSILNDYETVVRKLLVLSPDSSGYERTERKVKIYLSFLKEMNPDSATMRLTDSLTRIKNKEIALEASLFLIETDRSSDREVWKNVFETYDDPYELIMSFKENDRLNVIPKAYVSQDSIAKYALLESIAKTDHYRSPIIEKFTFVKAIISEDNEGEKQRYYLYKYYKNQYKRTRYMALSAPQPLEKSEVNWDVEGIYFEEPFVYKAKKKKVIKKLIEQIKSDEVDSIKSWEETTAVEEAAEEIEITD